MEPEVAEMNMLRGSLGVMWMIGSGMSPSEEHRRIWGKKKKKARPRWFGHVQRRDSDYMRKMMLEGDKDTEIKIQRTVLDGNN